MSFDLTRIGFFQFDNLVRNRVPFVLLHEEIAFSEIYGPVEKIHLEKWAIPVNFDASIEETLGEMKERRLPVEVPVVLLGRSGDRGQSWIERLEQAGYRNACFVPGGWERLLGEKDEV